MTFFEQIADMPQHRGCLSWDGVKGREKRDAGEVWKKEDAKTRNQGDEQQDLRLCKKKKKKGDRRGMRCLGTGL